MCELHYKNLFHDKNNIKLLERENNDRKKPFGHRKFYDTKKFKSIKQIQKLPTGSKRFTEVVIFAAGNTFFSVEFGMYH